MGCEWDNSGIEFDHVGTILGDWDCWSGWTDHKLLVISHTEIIPWNGMMVPMDQVLSLYIYCLIYFYIYISYIFKHLYIYRCWYLYFYVCIYANLYICICVQNNSQKQYFHNLAPHDYPLSLYIYIYGWWLVSNMFFPYIGNHNPKWLVFFRGVETTNWWWSLEIPSTLSLYIYTPSGKLTVCYGKSPCY